MIGVVAHTGAVPATGSLTVDSQLRRLLDRGLADLAGRPTGELSDLVRDLRDEQGATLVVHPALVPPSALVRLLLLGDKPGFVVVDMDDVDEFVPRADVDVPDRPLYLVHDAERGDEMRSWSPDEALPSITERSRTPLTLNEGISWLLQTPTLLEPNHCFMTIGSRKPTSKGLDARTPAIWISGGTGRDGKDNKGAPKVGWCWAGNRHTWLGFASASRRSG